MRTFAIVASFTLASATAVTPTYTHGAVASGGSSFGTSSCPVECKSDGNTIQVFHSTLHGTGLGDESVHSPANVIPHTCVHNKDTNVCECTCAAAAVENVDPAVGTNTAVACPDGRYPETSGCPVTVSAKMGGYSQNQCNNGVTGTAKALPQGHRYLRVALVCRQGGCGANLKNAEIKFGDASVMCKGNCGSGTAQCSSKSNEAQQRGANPAYTTYGPIPDGTTWNTYGNACNGHCANNYIADSWAYYKTASCFEDDHCASGTCTNNVCA